MSAPGGLRFWFCIAALVAFADQGAKLLAAQFLSAAAPIELAPFLRFVYAQNDGAAFSILAGRGMWARWLLTAFSIAACVGIIIWLRRRPPVWDAAALSLLLGGATGNLADRLRLGYVIDFIDAHWGA
ncbi:MAG: signal peptidase II, partial [Gammaproteobacteria bacterium]